MLDTIILAGGLGTRLAQTVPNHPKALAPILDTPFLEILLQQLERAAITSKLVMALGHKASDVCSYLKNRVCSFPIAFSIEQQPQGTGGALLQALDYAKSDSILVMNGDSFFDISLSDFYKFHKENKADFSIACRETEDASRYGILETNALNRISSFREKSTFREKGLMNAGVYLIEKKVLAGFPKIPCSLEKDLFPVLLTKNLLAHLHSGVFIDIGTHASYQEAQSLLKPWIYK